MCAVRAALRRFSLDHRRRVKRPLQELLPPRSGGEDRIAPAMIGGTREITTGRNGRFHSGSLTMSFQNSTHPPAILRRALLMTTLLCTPFSLSAVQAQESLAQETQPTNITGGDDIVVTGSRLIRNDLSAPSPVTVVGEQAIKLSGNVTLEKTLNQFPQLGQGNTSSVNNGGGSGILTANLRGLGATRTLTIVNGRRFIAANSAGSVDLGSIPDALVQRVDIVTGGASAVYGSDAIAGAINFVLKDNFKGLEAAANLGVNERGDGFQQKYDVTMGAGFDDNRGNVAMSFSYTKVNSFTQGDRAFSATPLADNSTRTGFVYSGSGNIPGTRIPLSATNLARVVGVQPASGGCTSVTSVRFLAGGTPAQYCSPEDSYNYAGFNLLQRPLERFNVSALSHYDVTDHVTAFMEAYFVNSKNNYILAPDSFTPLTPSTTNPLTTTLLVPYRNNPILPTAVANFFANNTAIFDPNRTGTASVTGAGRRTDEFGTRQSYFERTGYDITGGLRGDFDLLGRNFRWETFGQYIRNREDTRNIGTVNSARLSQSLDAVLNSSGQIACRSGVSGCVPVNLFGVGALPSSAQGWLTPERNSYNIFERTVAGASVSGSLFDLPAGPVAVAVGTEYRRDDYQGRVSPFDQAGDYGSASSNNVGGAFDVKEVFGEIRVPLLKDLPFVNALSIEGAVRYSDYSSVGGVLAYKAGAEYAPISWIRLRGAYNRAVRAPNVGELYAPISVGYTGGTDPCDRSQTRSAARQAFCVSQGINQADIANFTQSALGLNQRGGGNPNLKAEKSDTYTVGAVISPPWVKHLNFTVDYFNVKVKDAIIQPNVNQVLNDCFATLDASNPSCQGIVRDSSGQINYVTTQYLNVGYLKTSGIDAQMDWRVPLPVTLMGNQPQLTVQAVASWMFNKTQKTLASTLPQDCAGYYGAGCSSGTGGFILPDFKLNLSANIASGPVSWRWVGRMIGGLDLYPTAVAYKTHVPAVWYVDSTVTFDIGKKLTLFAGVNNIADKQPPILGTTLVGDANVDVSLYDVAGRRYFVGASVRF
jgi:outer membrane receptor protein involved in Fe transport